MIDVPVLVVGAGPTGLVLALWLSKLGVRVRIIDKSAEPGTTSRAVGVQARTLEYYHQADLADAVILAGLKTQGANLWVNGRHRARVPLGAIGAGMTPYPYLLLYPQDEHERFLIDRLSEVGVHVERQIEWLRCVQHADHVVNEIRNADGRTEMVRSAYLAGCDGARSAVRGQIRADFDGSTYEGMFYVADVEADGPAINGEINLELDEADFMAIFPLQAVRHVRLIGAVRPERLHDHEQLTFADIGLRAVAKLRLHITRVNWFSTYRVHHRVTSKFFDRRVFLLGDAAHIHSPVGGQGMNTGIGDAVNLAWKLADVLNGSAPNSLLATYEQERIEFARRLVATTDQVFTFVSSRGRLAQWVRTRIAPIILPLVFRAKLTGRLLFRTVSQININYRKCPINRGGAGRIRGGDRLPWVTLGPEGDNFAPLTSLKWQVHVYGESSLALANTCRQFDLALHRFVWGPGPRGAGLVRNAVYLIRPDGHIAFADPRSEPCRLTQYLSAFRNGTLK